MPLSDHIPGGRGRGQSDWAGEGEGEAPVSRVQKRNTEPETMGCHGHRFGPLKVKNFRYQNVRTRRKVRNAAIEAVGRGGAADERGALYPLTESSQDLSEVGTQIIPLDRTSER